MALAADFSFNQSSLQDYLDCQRRFELRYLLRLSWPAVEIEPALENERFLRRGSIFHRLVHQHQRAGMLRLQLLQFAGLVFVVHDA